MNASPKWAAEPFASLGGDIEQVDVAGNPAWQLTGDDVGLGSVKGGRLRQLDRQVARIGEILDADAVLTIGPVTVGGHA